MELVIHHDSDDMIVNDDLNCFQHNDMACELWRDQGFDSHWGASLDLQSVAEVLGTLNGITFHDGVL